MKPSLEPEVAFAAFDKAFPKESTMPEFDEWEKAFIVAEVNAKLLVYLTHYHGAGLKPEELQVMRRLQRLSDKLETAGV